MSVSLCQHMSMSSRPPPRRADIAQCTAAADYTSADIKPDAHFQPEDLFAAIVAVAVTPAEPSSGTV
jgi:hypothetical protein